MSILALSQEIYSQFTEFSKSQEPYPSAKSSINDLNRHQLYITQKSIQKTKCPPEADICILAVPVTQDSN